MTGRRRHGADRARSDQPGGRPRGQGALPRGRGAASGAAVARRRPGDRAGTAHGAGVHRAARRRGRARGVAGREPGGDRRAAAEALAAAAVGAAAGVRRGRGPGRAASHRARRRDAGRSADVRAGDRDQGHGAAAGQLRVPRACRGGRRRGRGQAGRRRVRPPGRDHAHRSGPRPEAGPDGEPGDREARRQKMRRIGRLRNFGIRRVERLDGNVGYIDLRWVAMPAAAGPAIAAAMELVAGTYALVIDLRRNGGGSPDGVAFWCSYLLDEKPTHLNDIFHADTGETRQFWALPYLPGDRYLDRPVYLLTSGRTFSGGEDLCYTLQAFGRAQVVGETTGGGAHPTRPFPVSAAVHIAVPFARSVSPVTGTNWQGTGVVPDIPVPEAEAYDVAYARALEHVLDLGDVPPPIRDEARDALAALGGGVSQSPARPRG